MSTHLQIARTEGAKAGFRHYMSQHTPTAADRRDAIRSAGNKKAQFEAYCALFSDQLGRVNGNGAVRSEQQREDVRESLTDKLARLLSRDTEDTDEDEVGVQVFDQEDEQPVEPDAVLSLVAGLLNVDVETLQAVVSGNAPATVTQTTSTTPAAKREVKATRISWPMCGTLIRAAKAQGAKFVIVDKDGGEGTGEPANYHVTWNGRKLTPAKASALIGAYKASK